MSLRLGLSVAACAVVVVAALPFVARYLASSHARVAVREYTTVPAQMSVFELPDGSEVVLAPVSRLRYTETPNGERQIDLEGEAYFTVPHDATRPFVVRAGEVATRVLGTSFNVRRYAGDSVTQVAVVDGKVMSGGIRSSILLTAGMAAILTDSATTRHSATTVDAITGWTRGRLVFRDAPLPSVLQTVGRWCGYELQVADSSMTTEQVTTVLHIGHPEKTLKMLEELLDVVPTVDGRVITLHPRVGSKIPAPTRRIGRDTTSFFRG